MYASLAIVFAFRLPLTEQESYYWLWSKNLDWGYFDHPPLQAWVTALLTAVFGDEKWVVRMPALIGDFATLAIFYRWTKEKWGQDVAQLCSLLLISSAVFMMGSVIALPDSLAVPLGLAAIIYSKKGDIFKSALFLGIALLSKWTVLFIVPGIFYELYRHENLSKKNVSIFFILALLIQSHGNSLPQ